MCGLFNHGKVQYIQSSSSYCCWPFALSSSSVNKSRGQNHVFDKEDGVEMLEDHHWDCFLDIEGIYNIRFSYPFHREQLGTAKSFIVFFEKETVGKSNRPLSFVIFLKHKIIWIYSTNMSYPRKSTQPGSWHFLYIHILFTSPIKYIWFLLWHLFTSSQKLYWAIS